MMLKWIRTLAASSLLAFAVVPVSASTSIPSLLINDLREDFDLKDFQAAAIVGSLAGETGDFEHVYQIGAPNGGVGYAQWTGSRRTDFERFAGGRKGVARHDKNYGFLKKELEEEYVELVADIRNTKNLNEATRLFTVEYLRPNRKHRAIDKRVAYAKGYLKDGMIDGTGSKDVDLGRRPAARPESIVATSSIVRPAGKPESIMPENMKIAATEQSMERGKPALFAWLRPGRRN